MNENNSTWVKVSRSGNKSCRAETSPKKQTNEFVFLSWRLGNTWNLKSKFKFQVFPSHQDRKTNSFVCFLGLVIAQQFCFEIYWPLEKKMFCHLWIAPLVVKYSALIGRVAVAISAHLRWSQGSNKMKKHQSP